MIRSGRNIMLSFFSILIFLLLESPSFGSGLCCQLSSGVQESLSGVATSADREVSFQLTYSFTRMDKLKQGTSEISLDEAIATTNYTELPVSMNMVKYTITAGYEFSSRFKAFIAMPYLRNSMDMIMSNGVGLGWMDMTMEPTAGPGDATLMGLYRIYADRELRPEHTLTAGIGVKTATGSSTETTSNGQYVHAHMQTGTGSWDPLVSLLYTHIRDHLNLHADVTYQYTTRNRQGYEFGDSTAVTFNATYAAASTFNTAAGITYLHIGRANDLYGKYTNLSSLMDDPANTGGKSIWFSPEVQVLPAKNALIDMKLQFPLWEKVNGIQLVSSYRMVLSFTYRF